MLISRYPGYFLIAAAIEVPLILALAFAHAQSVQAALVWYHRVPLSILAFLWLALFGHGAPPIGALSAWHALFLLLVYIGQIIVTAPIVSLLAHFFRHLKRSQSAAPSV